METEQKDLVRQFRGTFEFICSKAIWNNVLPASDHLHLSKRGELTTTADHGCPGLQTHWSIQETLDLIAVWGEESVQAELRTSRRNADIYAKIAQGMGEKGYTRDTQQCHVKIKELRQAYQKTREVNSRSGAEPQTCHFYEQLHAILAGDPNTVHGYHPGDPGGHRQQRGGHC
ncbi:myb/SANT-like DNA-binding domain-containing protein 7 [Natator depressus]|uniref:myb/SANT-like DNA-binding domain-containing protein 7 n=1 Tax=Natator depressus TaxID=27790 RepID=UPI003EC0CCA1